MTVDLAYGKSTTECIQHLGHGCTKPTSPCASVRKRNHIPWFCSGNHRQRQSKRIQPERDPSGEGTYISGAVSQHIAVSIGCYGKLPHALIGINARYPYWKSRSSLHPVRRKKMSQSRILERIAPRHPKRSKRRTYHDDGLSQVYLLSIEYRSLVDNEQATSL